MCPENILGLILNNFDTRNLFEFQNFDFSSFVALYGFAPISNNPLTLESDTDGRFQGPFSNFSFNSN